MDFLETHQKSHNLKIQLVEGHDHDSRENQDHDDDDDRSSEEIIDLSGLDADSQSQVLIAMRAGGFRGKVRTARGAGGATRKPPGGERAQSTQSHAQRATTPPKTVIGSARPTRCGNCGGEHPTRECPKPQLEFSKRACFGCGLPGHTQRDCPNNRPRGGGPGRANVVENDTEVTALIVDSEGYTRPRRSASTLNSFRAMRAGLSQKERRQQDFATCHNMFSALSDTSTNIDNHISTNDSAIHTNHMHTGPDGKRASTISITHMHTGPNGKRADTHTPTTTHSNHKHTGPSGKRANIHTPTTTHTHTCPFGECAHTDIHNDHKHTCPFGERAYTHKL